MSAFIVIGLILLGLQPKAEKPLKRGQVWRNRQ